MSEECPNGVAAHPMLLRGIFEGPWQRRTLFRRASVAHNPGLARLGIAQGRLLTEAGQLHEADIEATESAEAAHCDHDELWRRLIRDLRMLEHLVEYLKATAVGHSRRPLNVA